MRSRVESLVDAAGFDGLDPGMPLRVQRLLLDLAHVAPRVERVHSLACWLGAVAQSIEGEDSRAASLAVSLGTIVQECELIERGVSLNAQQMEAA